MTDCAVLAVSWAMPPILNARAIQVSRTLATLADLGWSSQVICLPPGGGQRASPGDPTWRHYLDRFQKIEVASPDQKWPFQQFWRFVLPLKWLDVRRRLWAQRALPVAEARLASGRFAALITFAQPWVDHVIGLHLHRKTGLPWIAHFSDPWVDSPYLGRTDLLRRQWRGQEQAVIAEADAVIFTNAQTVDLVMRKYPAAWRDRVHVIPHGYDPALLSQLGAAPPAGGRLRLAYTGNFYRRRTPLPLLRALASLKDDHDLAGALEVVFVGLGMGSSVRASRSMGLGDLVTFRGSLPYLESLRVAAEADVLLVIDAPSQGPSVFLPSKLVDYLMLRKPILGITPLQGASADLLRRLECPVVAPDDVPGIAGALSDLFRQWRQGRLAVSPAYERVAQEYDIRRTTLALDAILRQLVGDAPSR